MKNTIGRLCLVALAASLLPAGAATGQVTDFAYVKTITYDSVDNPAWFDTGFDLELYNLYALVPYGRTRISGLDWQNPFGFGPEGGTSPRWGDPGENGPMNGAPHMALIGRVGEDGIPIYLGGHGSGPVFVGTNWAGAGRLYLIVNDNWDHPGGWADNLGTLWVDVYVALPTSIGEGDRASSTLDSPRMKQNYPNPFNPNTMIEFAVGASGGHTTLKIYNASGQLVRTLLDGVLTPGSHHSIWDGADNSGKPVPSGVYFYRLQTPDGVEQKKAVMLK